MTLIFQILRVIKAHNKFQQKSIHFTGYKDTESIHKPDELQVAIKHHY